MTMIMHLGHIELFVADPQASKKFYRDVLGFEVISEQNEKFIWMRLGDREILLRPGRLHVNTSAYAGASVGIVLYTDDLETTRDALRSRGLQFKGTDGSDKCLTFTDLDGHWFQLVNPENH